MKPSIPRVKRALPLVAALALALATGACATASPEETARVSEPSAAESAVIERVLTRAETALQAGSVGDAKIYFHYVLRHEPDNPRARLGLGEIALLKGETAKARELFTALLDAPDVGAHARQGLGLALLKKGEAAAAVETLSAAVAADPSLWRAWNGLGAAHDTLRDWDRATASYNKALELVPDSAIVENNLGFSLVLQERNAEAIPHLIKAVRLDRGLEMARVNLRLALAWEGRYDEAIAGAEKGELPAVLNNVGYIALLRGDYQKAEALLTQALESSPAYFEPARLNLNHLYALNGRQT